MGKSIVTVNDLQELEHSLSHEMDRFDEIKSSMEQFFNSFVFHDPVLHHFKTKYEEKLAPIEKLFLDVDMYRQFLHSHIDLLKDYLK